MDSCKKEDCYYAYKKGSANFHILVYPKWLNVIAINDRFVIERVYTRHSDGEL
mgnify:CR=1 FL=1